MTRVISPLRLLAFDRVSTLLHVSTVSDPILGLIGRRPSALCSQDWLMKYGYLPAPDPSTGQLQAWTSVTSAVKAMQRFAGLRDTGVLGERCTPLCSVLVFEPSSSAALESPPPLFLACR